MPGAETIYTDMIRKQSGKYYAAWQPEAQFSLGDYGYLKGKLFIYQGNVKRHLAVKFDARVGTARAWQRYTTSSSTQITFTPQVKVPANPAATVAASMDIQFTARNSVFFNAAGCVSDRIDDMTALERDLLALRRKKPCEWLPNWVVITEIIRSPSTLVFISGAAKSSVKLDADINVPKINLDDVGIKLDISHEGALDCRVNSRFELTPMFELRGIVRGGIFGTGSEHFSTRAVRARVARTAASAEGKWRLARL